MAHQQVDGAWTRLGIHRYRLRVAFALLLGIVFWLRSPRYGTVEFYVHPLAILLVLLLRPAMTLAKHWTERIRNGDRLAARLKSLPNDYTVLNDIVLPHNKSNVDRLLIGPNGIFAVQVENYSGFVKCDGDEWFVQSRRIISLSKQARRNAMAIRSQLGELYRERKDEIPYVVPLLIFTNPCTKLRLTNPSITIVKLHGLLPFVLQYQSKRPLPLEERRAIVQQLELLQHNAHELLDPTEFVDEPLREVS